MAGNLKLELAQYREMLEFAKFGSDIDASTQKLLNKGARLTEVLKQSNFNPQSAFYQTFQVGSGVLGFLNNVNLNEVESFLNNLKNFLFNSTFFSYFKLFETDKKNFSNLLIILFYYVSFLSEYLEKNKELNNITFSENIWVFNLDNNSKYTEKLTYYVI